ncbi:SHOCT domain-containing protein [Methylobrevis pamukkalensis]|uniref:SHOCT domain-containing protein n=1 Tax=Methylobrevis pamukkalensis TaxID=1439726 RepID=A0A1E3H8H5_9HYPH|nr:SHOCT domain-containing protein [Methylobrevis pamukkalensis]ODN72639.1 hypothetical protein A6302_00132 [Methylobrevis pamukkalensis]
MTSPGLTEAGASRLADIAARHGFSAEAAADMLRAMLAGGGRMAQFGHPEFGGMGQWSAGGMLMIGDMFNNQLKWRVAGFADELGAAVSNGEIAVERSSSTNTGGSMGGQSGGFASFGGFDTWWPDDLGSPSSSGSQNGMRYAVFPGSRRLAIDARGTVTIYDTGDHAIGGVSQQQGSSWDLNFQSQYGTVRASDLQRVTQDQTPAAPAHAEEAPPATTEAWDEVEEPPQEATPAATLAVADSIVMRDPMPEASSAEPVPTRAPAEQPRSGASHADIFDALERLAGLRDKGILTEDEFQDKKRVLLDRL